MRPKGQAAAEFALMLPLLALIVMGLVDFGRVFAQYIAAVNAAREGARYCALNPQGASESAASARTRTRARIVTSGTTPDTAEMGNKFQNVTLAARIVAPATGNAGSWVDHCPAANEGQDVEVRVTIPFSPITPLVDNFFPQNPLPVGGTARFIVPPAP